MTNVVQMADKKHTLLTITNSMELSTSREAVSREGTQEFSRILCNPKVYDHVDKRLPLVPTWNQINPVHTAHPILPLLADVPHSISVPPGFHGPSWWHILKQSWRAGVIKHLLGWSVMWKPTLKISNNFTNSYERYVLLLSLTCLLPSCPIWFRLFLLIWHGSYNRHKLACFLCCNKIWASFFKSWLMLLQFTTTQTLFYWNVHMLSKSLPSLLISTAASTFSKTVNLFEMDENPLDMEAKVKLFLCLTKQALQHGDVWGSGCMDPHFVVHGNSWRWVASFMPRLTAVQQLKCLLYFTCSGTSVWIITQACWSHNRPIMLRVTEEHYWATLLHATV
jgi:hypothetical protein